MIFIIKCKKYINKTILITMSQSNTKSTLTPKEKIPFMYFIYIIVEIFIGDVNHYDPRKNLKGIWEICKVPAILSIGFRDQLKKAMAKGDEYVKKFIKPFEVPYFIMESCPTQGYRVIPSSDKPFEGYVLTYPSNVYPHKHRKEVQAVYDKDGLDAALMFANSHM